MKSPKLKKQISAEIVGISVAAIILALLYNFFMPIGLFSLTNDNFEQEMANGEIPLNEAYEAWQQQILFIDVRSEFVYQQGHIQNAISLPYIIFEASYDSIFAEIDRNQKIILYCSDVTCNAAELTFDKLKARGWEQVFYFKEGFHEWNKAGLPVNEND